MDKSYHNKPRHLRAIESIDQGLREADQLTIPDGIREGIKAGRLTPEVGAACLKAYERTSHGMTVVPTEELPDDAA